MPQHWAALIAYAESLRLRGSTDERNTPGGAGRITVFSNFVPMAGLGSQLRRSVRCTVTTSPSDLPIALRTAELTGSLWVPSPSAMNAPWKG